MPSINWQPTSPEDSPNSRLQTTVSTSNPWFGVAMGLLGFIVGFLLRTYVIAL